MQLNQGECLSSMNKRAVASHTQARSISIQFEMCRSQDVAGAGLQPATTLDFKREGVYEELGNSNLAKIGWGDAKVWVLERTPH